MPVFGMRAGYRSTEDGQRQKSPSMQCQADQPLAVVWRGLDQIWPVGTPCHANSPDLDAAASAALDLQRMAGTFPSLTATSSGSESW